MYRWPVGGNEREILFLSITFASLQILLLLWHVQLFGQIRFFVEVIPLIPLLKETTNRLDVMDPFVKVMGRALGSLMSDLLTMSSKSACMASGNSSNAPLTNSQADKVDNRRGVSKLPRAYVG